MSSKAHLLFVYNADSGFFNLLSDITHKIISPESYDCSLCAVTHGYFSEKKEWREFLDSLPSECIFLHRDEFQERYPEESLSFPAVIHRDGGNLEVCLDSTALNSCENLRQLQKRIQQHCLNGSDEAVPGA